MASQMNRAQPATQPRQQCAASWAWFGVSAKGFLSSRELTEELKDKQHLKEKSRRREDTQNLVWSMWITEEHTAANGKEAVVDQVIKGFPGNWHSAWLCPMGCGGSY